MKLPREIFNQHVAVLGKTRSGKSSVMRLFVEDLLRQEKPVCVVDPKGDWWGLKSSADGKKAGFPVVIFGGEHADVPLNAHAGAQVAELVATGNRPCIIDLGGWMPGDRTRFFIDFASGVFRATKGHRWLVIDEVHNFCPQGKVLDPDAGKMLHWTNRLFSEGLGKGLAIIAASQRPQKWHKDALTCCETLVAMRVIHKLDRDAMKDWIDGAGDAKQGLEVLNSIASMQRGEGWVWSPEIGFGPKRIQFPMFETYDSFRPRQGESAAKLKGWADVDLTEVSAKLAATIQEAKANDLVALKARIRELEKIVSKGVGLAKEVVKVESKRVEVPVLKDGQLARIENIAKSFGGTTDKLCTRVNELQEAIVGAVTELYKTIKPAFLAKAPPPVAPRAAFSPPVKREPRPPAEPNGALGKGERRILTAIVQHADGCTREQLTILTGYKRSSRDTYLQRIISNGYAEQRGDRLIATDTARDVLGDVEELPTGDALREYWLNRLGGGERAILEVVCGAYPKSIDREAISEATQYQRSSRDTYLQRLSARRLVVTDRGTVTAAAELFD